MPILRLTISSLSSLSHSFRSFLFVLSILFIALMNSASARILVDVKDPDTLKALENSGFGVAHVFEAHSNTNNLDTLYNQSELYRSFVHSIGKDIKHDPKTDQLPTIIPKNSGDIPEMVRLMRGIEDKGKRSSKDKKGGFYIRHLSNNSKHPYAVEADGDEPRHFDYRWLTSKHATFALTGIVNRIDKRDFNSRNSGHGPCGEVRFIYRLSYQAEDASSSMPFFLNAAYRIPFEDCKVAASLWDLPDKIDSPSSISDWLQKGALKDIVFDRLETNFQSLRFTSGYMHDFGGQAMYMQRVYQKISAPDGSRNVMVPITLENTPDVLAIKKNPKLLDEFLSFVKKEENLKKLDEGRLVIDFDDRFLAKRSVSWSTLGKERNANKPYRELLENSNAFDTLDFSAYKSINNKVALIERLDNLTCAGCHQSAGTAGFHFLGKPRDEFSHSFNRQELALSPHAHAEVSRRSQYIKALLEDNKDDASDDASFLKYRPHSMMPSAIFKDKAIEYEDLTVGASCSLGVLKDAPTCAAGLECRRTISSKHEALFGECVLEKQTSPEGYFAGGACIQGEITEVDTNIADKNPPTYNFFAFRDKFTITGRVHNNLGNGKNRYSCASPKSGAPLGRRGRACTANEESFKTLDDFGKGDNQRGLAGTELRGKEIPNELCANKGGNGFDTCAASGNAGACLESRVARAKLDSCSTTRFCREDYICQKFPEYQHISITDYGRKRRGIPVNMVKPTDIDGNIIAELHEQGVGFCVPTYFLFNMRVDGHPNPETGKAPGPPRIDRSQPLRGYK